MFDRFTTEAIKAHAREDYPNEACGFVTDEGYVRLANIAEKPHVDFSVSDSDYLKYASRILAVVHSHPAPENPAHPSELDMRQQMASRLTWGICYLDQDKAWDPVFWGDEVPIPPVMCRDFRHGPSGTDGRGDCYALGRDVFKLGRARMAEEGFDWPFDPIDLPEFPRNHAWWKDGQNHYLDHFEEIGFHKIKQDDAKPGDCVLMTITYKIAVPTHAALFLPGALLLHHMPNRASRTEPAEPWQKHFHTWLRWK